MKKPVEDIRHDNDTVYLIRVQFVSASMLCTPGAQQ